MTSIQLCIYRQIWFFDILVKKKKLFKLVREKEKKINILINKKPSIK